MPDRNVDVAILGGGLAGLCLALQLRRELPDASVLVAEKRAGPAPEAAFKVGESTVDLSAWYFGEVLGLRDHIEADQLPKCGLRFFLPADGNREISKRLEFGPRFWSPIPSYQLDRGRFENELAARVEAAGAERLGGTRVEEVDLSPDGHTVTLSRDGATETVSARWVVDAAGRASLLKRKLGLDRDCPHKINSSWFRLGGGIDIEDFSDDEEWLGRMMERGMRRLSTNHLMGDGYWCWLIPLSSGAISVGIVADPRFHPFEEINTLEGALDWLSRHEPQVADAVQGREDDIQDFLKIEDFSLGCERVYSPDRWALTGEAGTFADPLYSPGSDFIAMSNLLIGDLIARDFAGEEIGERLEGHNDLYFRVFDAWISEYLDQYQLFGNPLVFALKHTYNATNAWSVLILFYERRIADVGQWPEMKETLYRLLDLMPQVEALFRTWHGWENDEYGSTDVFPFTLAPLLQMLGTLVESRDQSNPRMDDDTLLQRVRDSLATLEGMAVVLFHRAGQVNPAGAPDPERPVDPYGVGLPPDRWEEAYSDDGLTLEQARTRCEGLDGVFEMVEGTFTLPGA